MALNPSIILAGQPVDFAGSMAAGNQLAAQTNQLRDQNALRQVFQTQGAGILQGNQQSLNALAAIDPAQAMQIQSGQLDMQATRQRMDMLTREEQRQLAATKASMTAAEAAAAAAEIEGAVKMGLAIQTPEQWDAMMAQQAPELVGQFNNRQALAAKYMSMAEVLKANAPPEPMSPQDRYKVVGSQLWDLGAEGMPRAIGEAPGQTETVFGPDGQPILQRGPASGVRFTEGQGKDNVYSTRAEGALAKLEPVADALASRAESILQSVPLGIGRELQTDEFQVARQAGDEFLQAILRKDTGAAITADEQQLYGVTYLPQPGDGPAVLQTKREARARALAALQSGMNADQFAATERALVEAARRIEQSQGGAAPAAGVAPTETPRRLRFNPDTGALE
jgi:hypothetical protein